MAVRFLCLGLLAAIFGLTGMRLGAQAAQADGYINIGKCHCVCFPGVVRRREARCYGPTPQRFTFVVLGR